MARAINNSIIEIKIWSVFNRVTAINVRHYLLLCPDNPLGVELGDIADTFSDSISEQWRDLLTQEAVYYGSSVQQLRPTMGVMAGSTVGNGVGTGGADAEAPQVCGLIKLTTELPGPRNRGRVFVPFPSETDVGVTGFFTTAYVNKLKVVGEALSINIDGNYEGQDYTIVPVIYHRVPGTHTAVDTYVARTVPATQRRRSLFHSDAPPPF